MWSMRAVPMLPVAVHRPVPGSYSSAVATSPAPGSLQAQPPVTSTVPSDSNVAVWPMRPWDMLPVAVQRPVTGSYSSAAVKLPSPPATSTRPSPQQRRREIRAGLDHAPGRGPFPGSGVVQLSGCASRASLQLRVLGTAAHHEDPAVDEERGRVATPAPVHAPGGGPSPGARVIQLGRGQRVAAVDVAARHQHLAVGQQGGGMTPARPQHRPGGDPLPAARIEQFGGGGDLAVQAVVDQAASNEHSAVGQQRGGVVGVGRDHVPGGVPRGWRCRGWC